MTTHNLGPLVLWTDGERFVLMLEDEYKLASGRLGPNGTLVADEASQRLSAGHACDVVEVMLRERAQRENAVG